MKKIIGKITLMGLILILGFSSCENPIEVEFPEVLIINQAPQVTPISSKTLKEISGPKTFDLSTNVNDQENDALSFVVNSSDPGVVEASINGSILTLRSVSIGTAVISVDVTDSNGNAVSTTIGVSVEEGVDLVYALEINFDVPDGGFTEQMQGAVEEVNDIYSEGSFISSGSALIGPSSGDWVGIELFTQELDISNQPRFEFSYANVNDATNVNIFFGAGEEFSITMADLGEDVVLGNPGFNTIVVEDLQAVFDDLDIEADLSAVFAIGFNTEASGNSFNVDDVRLGIKE
ncbi:hypothetical protein [Flagellimonas algicola]|uniref:BIG2 domain-containing protein n=1 Tax=Flagellimonas algicola TaxID=2583815 RepID=A0ABY2WIF8_9FLAO|nr:hypothetical protein [Allomuricauda algicola]TMU54614.1 hypothetical protein FGG15_10405 [Allomuricauda algicola]